MDVLGGTILIFGFISLAKLFNLVERNIKVIELSKSSVAVVRDNNIDDYKKEIVLQKYAKELFTHFFLITGTSVLAIGIPFGFIWLMDFIGLLSFNKIINAIKSVEFILISVAISFIAVYVKRKKD